MATVQVHPTAPSPTLRDKIRLFEGRSTSSSDFRSNSPYRATPRPFPIRTERDRTSVGDSSKYRLDSSSSSSSHSDYTPPHASAPPATIHDGRSDALLASPRKWNVITLDAIDNNKPSSKPSSEPSKRKGKEKVTVLSLDEDDDDGLGREDDSPTYKVKMPMLAKSPRRPSAERRYEEEVIKLKRLTTEEKQMVKALIKLSARKNKMLDNLENNIQRERHALAEQVEVEKASLSNKLQVLDAELANRSRELSAETMKNNDLAEKIHRLERERQDIRVSFLPTPLRLFPSTLKMALAASKRESKQCKINCESELNKKTQSLMDMAMQLTALTCLRQSMNCLICEEKLAIVVLQPCRHMVLCGPCSQKVAKCPMCRVDIRSKFEIYNNWVL